MSLNKMLELTARWTRGLTMLKVIRLPKDGLRDGTNGYAFLILTRGSMKNGGGMNLCMTELAGMVNLFGFRKR